MKKQFRSVRSPTPGYSSIEGYSLIEAMAALVILGVVLSWSAPLFLYARIETFKAKQQMSAQLVAQNVMAELESRNIALMPASGNEIVTDPQIVKSMGKTYEVEVIFCPMTAGVSMCRVNYKQVNIEIKFNGSIVYVQQAGFINK